MRPTSSKQKDLDAESQVRKVGLPPLICVVQVVHSIRPVLDIFWQRSVGKPITLT